MYDINETYYAVHTQRETWENLVCGHMLCIKMSFEIKNGNASSETDWEYLYVTFFIFYLIFFIFFSTTF